MTRIKLAFIHRFTDRHGKVRHYFRRPGYKQVPLPGLPGSVEFMAAYQAALAGETAPLLEIGADRTKPRSVSALAVLYYRSAEFQQLAPVTQATYRNIIERFRADHGDKPVAVLERRHVRGMVAAKAATPAAANGLFKMLRILLRLALDEGWRQDDPTYGVRRVKVRSDGFRSWTEEDIAAFEARWPSGTRERLALELLLYTAQRKGDVVRMGRQHVRSGAIEVRQGKTGARLSIPIHSVLQAELATLPADQLGFLVTRDGVPFTSAGFGNWFADAVREAGLPKGCSAHGLRKAAARRLAEAGCTAHQIMAITGHWTLKEVTTYTRAADQRTMAEAAISSIGQKQRNGK